MLSDHGKTVDDLLTKLGQQVEVASKRSTTFGDRTADALRELLVIQCGALISIAKTVNEMAERLPPPSRRDSSAKG